MNTLTFPSGPWTGFFNYAAGGQKVRTDMVLHFTGDRVTGEGCDSVGPFVIDGRFSREAGDCWWMKNYVGAHSVWYRGFREGKGIWGTWEIPGDRQGGFQIWPVGEEPAEASAATREEEIPAEPVRAS